MFVWFPVKPNKKKAPRRRFFGNPIQDMSITFGDTRMNLVEICRYFRHGKFRERERERDKGSLHICFVVGKESPSIPLVDYWV